MTSAISLFLQLCLDSFWLSVVFRLCLFFCAADGNGNFVKETAFCSALQILYKDLAGKTLDLQCRGGKALYECFAKKCYPARHGGESKADCEASCGEFS